MKLNNYNNEYMMKDFLLVLFAWVSAITIFTLLITRLP
jgi:hypothetical protein